MDGLSRSGLHLEVLRGIVEGGQPNIDYKFDLLFDGGPEFIHVLLGIDVAETISQHPDTVDSLIHLVCRCRGESQEPRLALVARLDGSGTVTPPARSPPAPEPWT